MLRCRLARDRPSAAQVAETVPLTGIADANPFGQGVLSRTISGAIGANWIPSRSASFFGRR